MGKNTTFSGQPILYQLLIYLYKDQHSISYPFLIAIISATLSIYQETF